MSAAHRHTLITGLVVAGGALAGLWLLGRFASAAGSTVGQGILDAPGILINAVKEAAGEAWDAVSGSPVTIATGAVLDPIGATGQLVRSGALQSTYGDLASSPAGLATGAVLNPIDAAIRLFSPSVRV